MTESFVPTHVKIGSGKQIGQTGRYQCRWCRFPVDAAKRKNIGSQDMSDGNIITVSGGVATNIQATQGCPMCGQFEWASKGVSSLVTKNAKYLKRRRIIPLTARRKRYLERF